MPRVPGAQITQTTAPIRPVFQNVPTNADTFGASQGRQLAELGGVLAQQGDQIGQIALRQQIEDNEREAKLLDTDLQRRIREISFGDGTEENPGFLNMRGNQALSGFGEAQEQINALTEEYSKSAGNDRIREMFSDAASARISAVMAEMSNHVSKERLVANSSARKARINEQLDSAALTSDPNRVTLLAMVAASEASDEAEAQGLSPEAVKSAGEETATSVYVTSITSALDSGREEEGMALFKAVKSRIDGREQGELAKKIQTKSMSKVAQDMYSKAEEAHPTDLLKRKQWIEENLSGDVENATLDKWKEDWSLTSQIIEKQRATVRFNQQQAAFRANEQGEAFYETVRHLSPDVIREAIRNSNLSPKARLYALALADERDSSTARGEASTKAQIEKDATSMVMGWHRRNLSTSEMVATAKQEIENDSLLSAVLDKIRGEIGTENNIESQEEKAAEDAAAQIVLRHVNLPLSDSGDLIRAKEDWEKANVNAKFQLLVLAEFDKQIAAKQATERAQAVNREKRSGSAEDRLVNITRRGSLLTPEDVMEETDLTPDAHRRWIDFANRSGTIEAARLDLPLFHETWDKISSGKITDESQIENLYGRGISPSYYNVLRAHLKSKRAPEERINSELISQARDAAASVISFSTLNMKDPKGEALLGEWMLKMYPRWEEVKDDPKAREEFLDPIKGEAVKMAESLKRPLNVWVNDLAAAINQLPAGVSLITLPPESSVEDIDKVLSDNKWTSPEDFKDWVRTQIRDTGVNPIGNKQTVSLILNRLREKRDEENTFKQRNDR